MCSSSSKDDSHSNSGSAAAAACSSVAVVMPPLAAKFVDFATALEAAFRATFEAVLVDTCSSSTFVQLTTIACNACADVLLPFNEPIASALLLQHGLGGPAALAREQQQLYSLLSSLQKLRGCIRTERQVNLGQLLAASCCWAAGHAAVWLLELALMPAGHPLGGPAATEQQSCSFDAVRAAAQQPTLACLPSLVLFGRCLFQWAKQLQQQSPELLLLVSGAELAEPQKCSIL